MHAFSSYLWTILGWKGGTSGGKATGAARLAPRTTSRGATPASSAMRLRGATNRRSRGAFIRKSKESHQRIVNKKLRVRAFRCMSNTEFLRLTRSLFSFCCTDPDGSLGIGIAPARPITMRSAWLVSNVRRLGQLLRNEASIGANTWHDDRYPARF